MAEHTILVALDGSELSEKALPYAAALAKAREAGVHLVTVWEEGDRALVADLPDVAESVFKKGEEHWESYLAGHAKALQDQGVSAVSEVVIGDAVPELLRIIGREQPDLLVLATHGRSGLSRWQYGSVADKLAREAPLPTLMLGPRVLESEPAPEIKQIMVPLDGSELAEEALQPAVDLARDLGAELLLARALQWAAQAMVYGVPDAQIGQMDEQLTKVGETYLTKVRDDLGTDRPVEAAVLHGPPADALITLAESRDIDLIVMTSHTRSGLERALMGSVADRLLQGPAPVLLVRPKGQG